ncbi:hypothetical protein CGCS363_v011544 [Colletotrichum siamense]|uniref:uncharacterized protein n=1 Tax=Colletotrichum siamense TaxID=690259 RepID=UPI0018722BAD|nr:uncharacterized protein CGCS363_v011544 [Colletotrichum siamense]KAF5492184.1 hypothetical protein CGCS363_v011544 [Colletotrichum siamense]
MKVSFVISMLSVGLTVQACDHYKICTCTNEDGSRNDDLTGKICDAGRYNRIYEKGYLECKHYKSEFLGYEAFDNCKFRKACEAVGGRGDSSCRAKVGIFKA